MRFPYEIYSLNWYLAVIAFRNSRRSKLANVPIKCYSENPKVKPVGTPMEIVKNKPDLYLKSIDIARYFEYAIRAEQEVIAGIEGLAVSEYISRLKSGTHFSIEALDSGRYSIHMIIYCSVPSAEVFCKDNLNVISPDASVYLSRRENFSKPISIWFVLFALSVVINVFLVVYLTTMKKRGLQSPNY